METSEVIYNFAAFRCNVCIATRSKRLESTHTPVLQCSKCKLISYCGQDHQRADWKRHKTFCAAVHNILRERNISHILDISGPIKNVTKKAFQSTRAIIKAVLLVALKRDLTPSEKEMIWFPKICASCYEYDAKKLEACTHCSSAFFCNTQMHSRTEHRLICDQLKLHYSICVENYPSLYSHRLPIVSNADVSFPNTLMGLLQHSTSLKCTVLPSCPSQYERFAAVCNHSNVSTLLFVLRTVWPVFHDSLVIHIVGASTEISLFTEAECWLIFQWLPTLERIYLFFIGPELPASSCAQFQYGRDKRVVLKYHRQSYESFWSSKARVELPTPHAIVCFNSGFSEFEDIPSKLNPWRPALNLILQVHKGIPIAFTSYVNIEAKSDLIVLRSIAEKNNMTIEVLCDEIRNPYRDLRPYRNWEVSDDEEIFYYNGYLNVVLSK